MWPKIMSLIKLSFFICYIPLWQHNRYVERCNIKTGPTRSCCLEPYPVGFWVSPRTVIPKLIWAPLLLFTLVVKSFPRFSQIFPCCSWWLLPSFYCWHTTQRHPVPSLKSHQLASAASGMVHHHLPLLVAQMGSLASPPPAPCAPAPEVPLLCLIQFTDICLVHGLPNKTLELWCSLGVPNRWRTPSLGLNTSWDAAGRLCHQSAVLAHVQLAIEQDPGPLLFSG